MSDPLTWRVFVAEMRPYPGRQWMTLRIVLGVLLAAVLVMALRIEEGWLSLYFSFVFAKPTTRATLLECGGVLIITLPVILLGLLMLRYAAEPAWLRLGVLAGVLFTAFFLANVMRQGDIPRNVFIIFATVLTLPDVYPYPHLWTYGAFKLAPVIVAGVLPVIAATLLFRPERNWDPAHRPPEKQGGILPDWRTNPAHVVYALKCTAAAMGTYFIYTLLGWQQIQTALMTCLILALPTTDQIIHKTWLRISGACVGAAIATVSAVWLIPRADSLGAFLAVIGLGSALAGWVALSSSRLSYAGWQMALAQFMMVTQSFGPATDLSVLKDRLIGILLGNVMMALTFKYLWPEKTPEAPAARAPRALKKALPALCVAAFALLLGGCQHPEELAPASPSQVWTPPKTDEYRLPPAASAPAAAPQGPDHEYTLSELADIAQRSNPKTRVAWEQARAASAAVSAVQSAYYPQLNLIAAAGYERVPAPLPQSVFPEGYFYSNIGVIRPELQLDWVLWDFGRRGALERGARAQSAAQNFAFNAVHQQVLWAVCQNYYKLVSLRSALAVRKAALADAELIERAVEASLKQGFATQAGLLQARQQVAQYRFEVSSIEADVRKAQVSLAESAGMDPGTPLRVRDLAEQSVPAHFETSVNALVDRALSRRADLAALVAELRAAQAQVEQIQAQAGPTLGLSGNFGPIYSAFNADNTGWVSVFEPQYGASLAVTFPVFDGFRRQNLTIAAQARKRQVEAAIAEGRSRAVREVWQAYTDFENACRQLEAARALVAASEASQAATLASFKHGFSDVTDLQTQQALLIRARESFNQARTDIFLSAALVQFATGVLTADNADGQPGGPDRDAPIPVITAFPERPAKAPAPQP